MLQPEEYASLEALGMGYLADVPLTWYHLKHSSTMHAAANCTRSSSSRRPWRPSGQRPWQTSLHTARSISPADACLCWRDLNLHRVEFAALIEASAIVFLLKSLPQCPAVIPTWEALVALVEYVWLLDDLQYELGGLRLTMPHPQRARDVLVSRLRSVSDFLFSYLCEHSYQAFARQYRAHRATQVLQAHPRFSSDLSDLLENWQALAATTAKDFKTRWSESPFRQEAWAHQLLEETFQSPQKPITHIVHVSSADLMKYRLPQLMLMVIATNATQTHQEHLLALDEPALGYLLATWPDHLTTPTVLLLPDYDHSNLTGDVILIETILGLWDPLSSGAMSDLVQVRAAAELLRAPLPASPSETV